MCPPQPKKGGKRVVDMGDEGVEDGPEGASEAAPAAVADDAAKPLPQSSPAAAASTPSPASAAQPKPAPVSVAAAALFCRSGCCILSIIDIVF